MTSHANNKRGRDESTAALSSSYGYPTDDDHIDHQDLSASSSSSSSSAPRPASNRLYCHIWHEIGNFLDPRGLATASKIDRSWNYYLMARPSFHDTDRAPPLSVVVRSDDQMTELLTCDEGGISKHVKNIEFGGRILVDFKEMGHIADIFMNVEVMKVNVDVSKLLEDSDMGDDDDEYDAFPPNLRSLQIRFLADEGTDQLVAFQSARQWIDRVAKCKDIERLVIATHGFDPKITTAGGAVEGLMQHCNGVKLKIRLQSYNIVSLNDRNGYLDAHAIVW